MTDANDTMLLDMAVSRETFCRLEVLVAQLLKWNPAINLVSKSSVANAWSRHVLDSAQIFSAAPTGVRHWVDLGSGGGFPGLVLATIAAERQPLTRFTLIESDQRKAAFLRQAASDLGLKVQVIAQRIETAPPQEADVVSARALAPLDRLLGYAGKHLNAGGVGIFPKGASFSDEVEQARKVWSFQLEIIASKTQLDAALLKVKDLRND